MRSWFRSKVTLVFLFIVVSIGCLGVLFYIHHTIYAISPSTLFIPTPTPTLTPTPITPTPTPRPTPILTPTPTPTPISTNILNGIAALSSTNMWAVGYSQTPSGTGKKQSLIEHYNGKQWTIISSPNVGTNDTVLTGITVFSTTNIWVVGYYQTSTGSTHTLIEHWNGTKWSVVSSPNI
jgi:hypothetical protein